MSAGLNNQKVRHHNKQVLLALLYQLKEASKSTLARHCELSIPAVSKILDELVAEGPSATASRTSPNAASMAAATASPAARAILCLNISPTSLESILVDNLITPSTTTPARKLRRKPRTSCCA